MKWILAHSCGLQANAIQTPSALNLLSDFKDEGLDKFERSLGSILELH